MKTPLRSQHAWPVPVVGAPITSGPLTVFPLLGGGRGPGEYRLLADAVSLGVASLTEVNVSGHVPVIVIENRGKLPVLGIQGEEYIGAKQNRSLNISVLAGRGKTLIPVTCVEQGRWRDSSPKFEPGAFEPMILRRVKTKHVSEQREKSARPIENFFADQFAVWAAVNEESARHGVRSATSSLHDVFESIDVRRRLDQIIAEIELLPDTRGVVVAIGGRIVAADIFDRREVFERIWPRMVRSYALSALGSKKGVPPSREAAESFVARPGEELSTVSPSVGLGKDVRCEAEDFLATGLLWRGRLLHASIFARGDL